MTSYITFFLFNLSVVILSQNVALIFLIVLPIELLCMLVTSWLSCLTSFQMIATLLITIFVNFSSGAL